MSTTVHSWWACSMARASMVLLLVTLCGCTGKRPPVSPPPAAQTVEISPPSAPPQDEHVTIAEAEPPQDPDVVKALQRYEKTKKFADVVTPTIVKYAFQPEREYALVCPEWGVLTVRLLPGEVLRRVVAGNPVEWMIDDTETGEEPAPLLAIRRAPYAPPTEAAFVTDRHIYRFLFVPGGPRGNTPTRHISFYDPLAELRRFTGQVAAAEQRQKKTRETRYPTLAFEHLQRYDVGGDAVKWRPIKVEGDHQHTMIELPAATGTAQPTLAVMNSGIETRINYRTIPGRNGAGPVMVADQAFTEARLIGEGGVVRITRRGEP